MWQFFQTTAAPWFKKMSATTSFLRSRSTKCSFWNETTNRNGPCGWLKERFQRLSFRMTPKTLILRTSKLRLKSSTIEMIPRLILKSDSLRSLETSGRTGTTSKRRASLSCLSKASSRRFSKRQMNLRLNSFRSLRRVRQNSHANRMRTWYSFFPSHSTFSPLKSIWMI